MNPKFKEPTEQIWEFVRALQNYLLAKRIHAEIGNLASKQSLDKAEKEYISLWQQVSIKKTGNVFVVQEDVDIFLRDYGFAVSRIGELEDYFLLKLDPQQNGVVEAEGRVYRWYVGYSKRGRFRGIEPNLKSPNLQAHFFYGDGELFANKSSLQRQEQAAVKNTMAIGNTAFLPLNEKLFFRFRREKLEQCKKSKSVEELVRETSELCCQEILDLELIYGMPYTTEQRTPETYFRKITSQLTNLFSFHTLRELLDPNQEPDYRKASQKVIDLLSRHDIAPEEFLTRDRAYLEKNIPEIIKDAKYT